MGMVGAAFGLGFIFGPALGGVLSRFSPETPMWFASALCFANFVAAWFLLPESRAVERHDQEPGPNGGVPARASPSRRCCCCCRCTSSSRSRSRALKRRLRSSARRRFGFTASTIGFVFAFIGVILALVQGVLVGKVVKIVRERQADSAGDPCDRGWHRADSVRVERADAARRARSCWRSAWASTTRRCRRWCRGLPIQTIRAASLAWLRRWRAWGALWVRRGAVISMTPTA